MILRRSAQLYVLPTAKNIQGDMICSCEATVLQSPESRPGEVYLTIVLAPRKVARLR